MEKAKQMDEKFTVERKKLKKLMKIRNINRCLREKVQLDFDTYSYIQLVKQMTQQTTARQIMEYRSVLKKFMKTKKSLKLDWEIIPTNDIRIIQKLLRSNEVVNLILISHGEQSSHIRDSRLNELPTSFSKQISPSIASLVFFDCHSQRVIDLYCLKKIMSNTPTRNCSIDLSNLHVFLGYYGVILNKNFITIYDKESDFSKISFDCSLIQDKNFLTIKDIRLGTDSIIGNLDSFEIVIEHPQNGKMIFRSQELKRRNNRKIIFKF